MPDSSTFHKILVIQTAFIGDVVLATALVEELHRVLPHAQVDFLLRKGNEGVFEGHPYIGKVLIWDKTKQKYWHLVQIMRAIRSERYDLVVNLQRFASTGFLTVMSGASTTACFTENPLSWLATYSVPYGIERMEGEHEVGRALRLLFFITHSIFSLPKIYPKVKENKIISPQAKYITISPASVWFTKQFPLVQWLDFMNRVGEDTTILLLGGKGDKQLCEDLRKATKHPNTIVKAGEYSFLESASLMKNAVMNYSNDSAPLHLASAVNAPITAIYCSTVPALGFTPLSDISHIVETDLELDCRPCGLHGKKACPKGHFKCSKIRTEWLLEKLPQ